MEQLTSEQRMKLAEWAGHVAQISNGKVYFLYREIAHDLRGSPVLNGDIYDPQHDDAQAMELLRELLDLGYLLTEWADEGYAIIKYPAFEVTGQTPNLAICHAALAAMEET